MYSRLDNAGAGPDMKTSETPVANSQCAQLDLIRRLRAGSAVAFRDFVELYQSQVYRVAYAITAQRDHAEEVAQRAFVKAYFSIKNFVGHGSLYAWIYRMAVDEAFLFLRNNRAHAILDQADRNADLGTICSRRDFINKLMDLIPEEDRCLLFLRDFEGHSVSYLTEVTGLPENTVKQRLLRTRQALAKDRKARW
jgi:RNA polymerase sigma-70 factor (ECF subfamily)